MQLDFSINTNPLGPPNGTLSFIASHCDAVTSYPDHLNKEALRAVSEIVDLPAECLALGSGATEFIFLLPKVLPANRAFTLLPSFWEYFAALEGHCAVSNLSYLCLDPNRDFEVDPNNLIKAVSGSQLAFIGNPNNPTSTLIPKRALADLIRACPATTIVIDETYLLFRKNWQGETLLPLVEHHRNLVVLFSFSKFFNIPGLRLGCAAANPETISLIRSAQVPFSLSTLAQQVLPFILADLSFVDSSRNFFTQERMRFFRLLRQTSGAHFQIFQPEANFVIIRNKAGAAHFNTVHALLEKGVKVRDCGEFRSLDNSWIRVAIRTQEDNDKFVTALNDALK